MRLIFLITILLFEVYGYSQITLNDIYHVPQIGDSINYNLVENPNFSQGNEGANQLWDFTNTIGGLYYLKVSSIVDANDSTNHSSSSVVINSTVPDLLTDLFYSYTDSTIIYDGQTTPNGTNEYFVDGRMIMRFPFTYLDMFLDTFYGYIYSNQNYTHNSYGTNEVFADGFGTISLPSGQFVNSLRVRTIWKLTWEQINSSNIQVIYDTTYSWYTSDTPYPVATYSILTHSGNTSKVFKYINNVTANSNVTPKLNQPCVYPNPGHDIIYFSTVVKRIEVQDLNGSNILEKSGNLYQIDISRLPIGVYIFKYSTDSYSGIEKLIIK